MHSNSHKKIYVAVIVCALLTVVVMILFFLCAKGILFVSDDKVSPKIEAPTEFTLKYIP